MEHYELEDVFGRRLRPVLRVGIKLRPREDPDPCEELVFSFLNEGRGLARHAGLLCLLGDGKVHTTRGGLSNSSAINDHRPSVQSYDPVGVVHPNGIYARLGEATIERANKGKPLKLTIKWYAENMMPREETLEIEPGPDGRMVY